MITTRQPMLRYEVCRLMHAITDNSFIQNLNWTDKKTLILQHTWLPHELRLKMFCFFMSHFDRVGNHSNNDDYYTDSGSSSSDTDTDNNYNNNGEEEEEEEEEEQEILIMNYVDWESENDEDN